MQRTSAEMTLAAQRATAAWFDIEPHSLEPFGEGHINSTWLARSSQGDFVLQRISQEVFPEPQQIAANLARLFEVSGCDSEFNYQLPEPIADREGNTLVRLLASGSGSATEGEVSYWRLCRLIANSRVLQSVMNVTQARAAGEAFGRFQRMAQAIEPASLVEVIPGFYQLDGYWRALTETVAALTANASAVSLAPEVTTLFAQLAERHSLYSIDFDLDPDLDPNWGKAEDGVGLSVIHGDCKVNNLLFAENADRVEAVLDLDTLMVGAWWLDFGDLIRSAAYDRDGVFRPAYYEAVAQGFFAGRGNFSAAELGAGLDAQLDWARNAPAHVAFMLAVRFLDDHLRGDRYFRVIRRGDNLQRAQAQFEQLQQLEVDDCQRFMRDTLQPILR